MIDMMPPRGNMVVDMTLLHGDKTIDTILPRGNMVVDMTLLHGDKTIDTILLLESMMNHRISAHSPALDSLTT
jgi:hypothetical protein